MIHLTSLCLGFSISKRDNNNTFLTGWWWGGNEVCVKHLGGCLTRGGWSLHVTSYFRDVYYTHIMVPGKMAATGAVPHREVHVVSGSFPSSLEQIGSKHFQTHRKLKEGT